MKKFAVLLPLLVLAACGDEAKLAQKQQEIEKLEAEITKVRAELNDAGSKIRQIEAENADLKRTPQAMLLAVKSAIDKADDAGVEQAKAALLTKFPDTPEASSAKNLVSGMVAARVAKEKEDAQLKALGFKAIPVNSSFASDNVAVTLGAAKIGNQWNFNDYGSGSEYRDAERGSSYVTAQVTFSSKIKDPNLLPLGVYTSNGGELKRLGIMGYEFTRWKDYGTFLGNYHDFGNDFSHTERIRFSMGLQVSKEDISKPLYIVAAKGACASKSENRFGNPPIRYSAASCVVPPEKLTIESFSSGQFGVLKRID